MGQLPAPVRRSDPVTVRGVQLDVIRWLVEHSLGGTSDAYLGDGAFMEETRAAVELLPAVRYVPAVALPLRASRR